MLFSIEHNKIIFYWIIYTWASNTGTLVLSNPTGAVTITIEGVISAQKLDTPQNLSISGDTLTFDAVPNAEQYEVYANGKSIGTYTPWAIVSTRNCYCIRKFIVSRSCINQSYTFTVCDRCRIRSGSCYIGQILSNRLSNISTRYRYCNSIESWLFNY